MLKSLPIILPILVAASIPIRESQTPAAPERLALIVGINRYEHGENSSGFDDLLGCVNDAERVQHLLRSRFHFEEESILVLTDEQATHAAIVRAFYEHLIQRAGPETEVVFWFSGHGSRVPDGGPKPSPEPDGMDSTLVATDSRLEGGAPDISDDELYSLLTALCATTPWVTVVTDCCHSGGVTRGPNEVRTRWAEEGTKPVRESDLATFWPEEVPFLEDGDPRRMGSLPHVHIAACESEQEANEYHIELPNGGTRVFGALTWYLTEKLERASPGLTYAQLVQETTLGLSLRYPDQDVQAEGVLERQVLRGVFVEPLPGFAAEVAEGSEWVEIDAGALQGLDHDLRLDVQSLTGKLLGTCIVSELEPYSSVARWEELPKIDDVQTVRVVPRTGLGFEAIRVHLLAEGFPAEVESALVQLENPAHERVEDARSAAYQLGVEADGLLALRTLPENQRLWQESRGALRWDGKRRAEAIQARLSREQQFRSLMELGGAKGAMRIQAEFQPMQAETLIEWKNKLANIDLRAADLNRRQSAGEGRLREGSLTARDSKDTVDVLELVLKVEANSPFDPHVAVLCISEDRSVSLIWPDSGSNRNNLIPLGREKRIPIEVYLNEGWSEPRPMRDRYLVIATRQHVDFSVYTRLGAAATRGEDTDSELRAKMTVPSVIQHAMELRQTRGNNRLDPEDRRFGVAAVDLFIEAE